MLQATKILTFFVEMSERAPLATTLSSMSCLLLALVRIVGTDGSSEHEADAGS
jgi:hypothetical protein